MHENQITNKRPTDYQILQQNKGIPIITGSANNFIPFDPLDSKKMNATDNVSAKYRF